MPGGARSWSKAQHLARIADSGHFAFSREVAFDGPVAGGVDRFIALMRSQGSYQGLRRLGLSDDEIGVTDFEHASRDAFARSSMPPRLSFVWRVRLGVKPR